MIAARPSGLRRTNITDSVKFSVSRLRFKKISLLVSSKSDIAVSNIAVDFVLTLQPIHYCLMVATFASE